MYCHFYGLANSPFKPTPDAKYFFPSPGHREALASILYHVHGHYGIVAIEGEVGTGKTTVIKAAAKMIRRRAETVYIFNPQLPFSQMFAVILYELKLLRREEKISKACALERLNRFARRQSSNFGNVVFFIDEAHLMPARTFENLRLLTNLESADRKLIQIVLAGHRGPMVFESKALKLIWRFSKGIPRLINKLCDNALLLNYMSGGRTIPASVIREVARNLQLNRSWLDFRVRQPDTLAWLRAR